MGTWKGVGASRLLFFDRGDEMQKSREGMLKGILYQVLSTRRNLITTVFAKFFEAAWPPPTPFTSEVMAGMPEYENDLADIRRLLGQTAAHLKAYRIMRRPLSSYARESSLAISGSPGGTGPLLDRVVVGPKYVVERVECL